MAVVLSPSKLRAVSDAGMDTTDLVTWITERLLPSLAHLAGGVPESWAPDGEGRV